MAQKFLSIKNFEKYQHYKHRNPPWIRLYGSLFQDPDFIRLPIKARYLYVGLLPLCARYENRVPLDCNWIAHMLAIDAKEVDLTPLYRSGFLLASRKHVASILSESAPSDSDNSDNSDSDNSDAGQHDPARASRVRLSDVEWMDSLRTNAGYAGVDIDTQRGRCEAWCQTNGKTFSRRRFVNWINRIDKPMSKPDWKEAFLRDEN